MFTPPDKDRMNRISESWTRVTGIGRTTARFGAAAVLFSAAVWGATFGTVVPIDIPVGGHVSDIVLDEPRGLLYIANFTARRIDVRRKLRCRRWVTAGRI